MSSQVLGAHSGHWRDKRAAAALLGIQPHTGLRRAVSMRMRPGWLCMMWAETGLCDRFDHTRTIVGRRMKKPSLCFLLWGIEVDLHVESRLCLYLSSLLSGLRSHVVSHSASMASLLLAAAVARGVVAIPNVKDVVDVGVEVAAGDEDGVASLDVLHALLNGDPGVFQGIAENPLALPCCRQVEFDEHML